MPTGLLNGSTVTLTGDKVIDAMTNGYRWALDSSRTVDWSLSKGWYGEYWSNPVDLSMRVGAVLGTFSYYANIKFNYVGYFPSPLGSIIAGADINYAPDGNYVYFNNNSAWAVGNFPNPDDPNRGDVYLNTNSLANYISYEPGSAGWFLLVHELGHTLGLKHPHDDGGTGRPTFSSLGWSNLDVDLMTVMSYNDNYNFNLTSYDPATPMILDVLALQYLYGKNTLTNSGNSTYVLSNSGMYITIWDASGIDVIDQSTSNLGWHIELPSVQLSTLVDTKAGFGTPVNDLSLVAPHSLTWLAGDIENIIGSNFSDQLYGNSFVNRIEGNNGNDVLDGGTGADTLIGGTGNDTYYVDNTSDRITEYAYQGTDTVYSGVSYTLSANVENLILAGTAYINGTGNGDANIITGNSGNNVLNGGTGADKLFGGLGNDTFQFTTALGTLDVINDFKNGADKIALDDAIFKAFSGKTSISSTQFKTITNTNLSGDGYLTYCTANETLYYDADGKGSGDVAVCVVDLVGTAKLVATDFVVI